MQHRAPPLWDPVRFPFPPERLCTGEPTPFAKRTLKTVPAAPRRRPPSRSRSQNARRAFSKRCARARDSAVRPGLNEPLPSLYVRPRLPPACPAACCLPVPSPPLLQHCQPPVRPCTCLCRVSAQPPLECLSPDASSLLTCPASSDLLPAPLLLPNIALSRAAAMPHSPACPMHRLPNPTHRRPDAPTRAPAPPPLHRYPHCTLPMP